MTTTTIPITPPVANHRLREARIRAGLPLRALTVLTGGIPAATLSAAERWGYRPCADSRRRIAEALDVSEAELWPDDQEQGSSASLLPDRYGREPHERPEEGGQ